ncbi:GNAT family N-acetyltransferase [Herbiconiux sp. 11R-BC]|uniref:GNAT family N-acetyltransferase n=1 Tax=Herbiconiux sp. 11R-BC TaxID=3111637 RepID=UPI003C0DA929
MSTAEYEFRTFPAAVESPGAATAATAGWLQAETQGFHEARLSDQETARLAAHMARDGHQLTGVYAAGRPAESLGADYPVATFASFEKTLNVGGAEPLQAHLISCVTVRPTHRRQGILRRVMTDDLDRAVEAGYAVAALTVSEATIYRRFGFGVATQVHTVTVATDARFRLLVSPRGRCELVDARELVRLGPEIFAGFHAAQPGSVDRQSKHWERISGVVGEKGEEDRAVRAALHYDESGAIDGYVSYRAGGYDTHPRVLEVVDLVAQNADAYLGLWEFLASVDLVDAVKWDAAPVDDPLRWALENWRQVAASSLDDWVWLRILDVVAAFEARGYAAAAAGEIVLGVTDPLGHAEGRYRLRVADGRAAVTRDDTAPCDLELDVSVLGSLYLGGADPVVLAAAGRLTEPVPGAARALRALLAPVGTVWGITHF